MTTNTNENALSRDLMKDMTIESLLALTTADVEELRELATVRSFLGQFTILKLSLQPSEGDNKGHVAMQYKLNSVLEHEETNPFKLPDAEEGAIFTERFYPGYGIQRLMKVMDNCVEEGTSIQTFLETCEGVDFSGMVKARSRKDPDTKEVKYFNELDVFSMIGPLTPTE